MVRRQLGHLPEGSRNGMLEAELRLACRAQDHQRVGGAFSNHVLQETKGVGVGPLQVVQDHEEP